MCFPVVLKVTDKLRRTENVFAEDGQVLDLVQEVVFQREGTQLLSCLAVVDLFSGFVDDILVVAVVLRRRVSLCCCHPHKLIVHGLLMRGG